jgi:positive regulator of sigma E activity
VAGVIERSGRIVVATDEHLTVRIERASSCNGCRAANVCSKASSTEIVLAAPAAHQFRPGDELTVGIDRGVALVALAIAYLLPFAAFIIAMLLASFAGLGDTVIAAVSFVGLGSGFLVSRFFARRPAFTPRPWLVDDSRFTSVTTRSQYDDR